MFVNDWLDGLLMMKGGCACRWMTSAEVRRCEERENRKGSISGDQDQRQESRDGGCRELGRNELIPSDGNEPCQVSFSLGRLCVSSLAVELSVLPPFERDDADDS